MLHRGSLFAMLLVGVDTIPRSFLMAVNKKSYESVMSAAQVEVESLVNSVDTSCALAIESTRHRQIRLEASIEQSWMPRLCLVNNTQNYERDKTKAVVLMLVNSLEYLQEDGNWLAFLNKASYCIKTRRSMYVWIGDLDSEILNGRNDVPWIGCREKAANTLNIYKVIALLAAFKKRKDTGTPILYLDADAWFSDVAFEEKGVTPEAYLSISSQAFLYGNQNRVGGPKIPLNGGLLALKDTLRAQRFLALWFYSRCGNHDQLPLWASLFATWSVDASASIRLSESNIFSRYRKVASHSVGMQLLIDNLDTLRRPILKADPRNTYDGGTVGSTYLLDVPLELPGVLLWPSAPIHILPAIRSDINKTHHTFCCHTRIDRNEDGQCRGTDICKNRKCELY